MVLFAGLSPAGGLYPPIRVAPCPATQRMQYSEDETLWPTRPQSRKRILYRSLATSVDSRAEQCAVEVLFDPVVVEGAVAEQPAVEYGAE